MPIVRQKENAVRASRNVVRARARAQLRGNIDDVHCPPSFIKSVVHLNVSPIDCMSSFTLSFHRSLGLPLFFFPSNPTASVLCGILSIVIISTGPKPPESSLDDFV